MASPAPHKWTPADMGVRIPEDNAARVGLLGTVTEVQRLQQREELFWGLAVAAGALLILVGGAIWFGV